MVGAHSSIRSPSSWPGGGRVELRGFGAFSTRQRDARIGRNPRTGEAVDVDAKRVPYFKPGKEMRERLNLRKSPPNSSLPALPHLQFAPGSAGSRDADVAEW